MGGKAILVLVLLTATAPGATTLPTAPICGVERESTAPCLNTSTGVEVCEHVASGSTDTVIELKRNGNVLHTWHVQVFGAFQGNPFRVIVGDLNGDGRNDIAVATFVSSSNGMVVNLWAVCAADGANLSEPTACVNVEDYGTLGYFTKQPGSRGCLLLQTAWRRGTEPARGDGLYLVGRWLRFEKGGFVTDSPRPLVARRLLFTFDVPRGSLSNGEHYAWFRDRRTRTVNCPDQLCGDTQ